MRNGIVRAPCSSTSFFSFLFALPLPRAPSFTCRGGIRLACRWQRFPAANLNSLHHARNLSLPQISQRRLAGRRMKSLLTPRGLGSHACPTYKPTPDTCSDADKEIYQLPTTVTTSKRSEAIQA